MGKNGRNLDDLPHMDGGRDIAFSEVLKYNLDFRVCTYFRP